MNKLFLLFSILLILQVFSSVASLFGKSQGDHDNRFDNDHHNDRRHKRHHHHKNNHHH